VVHQKSALLLLNEQMSATRYGADHVKAESDVWIASSSALLDISNR
jgi:hypothetical protein